MIWKLLLTKKPTNQLCLSLNISAISFVFKLQSKQFNAVNKLYIINHQDPFFILITALSFLPTNHTPFVRSSLSNLFLAISIQVVLCQVFLFSCTTQIYASLTKAFWDISLTCLKNPTRFCHLSNVIIKTISLKTISYFTFMCHLKHMH